MILSTKASGDIAEQAVVLKALQFGWAVLIPVGDRLPYDLVIDTGVSLFKIQVKAAWYDASRDYYVANTRRTKTNRNTYKIERYADGDFDFAIIYIDDLGVFYVLPSKDFIQYRSSVILVESQKRQRPPRSTNFRDAWHLIGSPNLTEDENDEKIDDVNELEE